MTLARMGSRRTHSTKPCRTLPRVLDGKGVLDPLDGYVGGHRDGHFLGSECGHDVEGELGGDAGGSETDPQGVEALVVLLHVEDLPVPVTRRSPRTMLARLPWRREDPRVPVDAAPAKLEGSTEPRMGIGRLWGSRSWLRSRSRVLARTVTRVPSTRTMPASPSRDTATPSVRATSDQLCIAP